MPTPLLSNINPHETLFGTIPNYNFLHVFGSPCYPYLQPYTKYKLEFHSNLYIFLGYSKSHDGYQCLHLPSSRIYIVQHVVFNEGRFLFAKTSSLGTTNSPCQMSRSMQNWSQRVLPCVRSSNQTTNDGPSGGSLFSHSVHSSGIAQHVDISVSPPTCAPPSHNDVLQSPSCSMCMDAAPSASVNTNDSGATSAPSFHAQDEWTLKH